MNFSAVILAGGQSRRMGRDKAFLETGGQILLSRQIQLAREIGAAEIFISGRVETDYSAFGCRVLQDKFSDAGPLSGIERALNAITSPFLLVLAVDLPEMKAEILRLLVSRCAENFGAIPRVHGNIEPLAAFYPKSAQSLAETLLCAGENSVVGFVEHCRLSGLARFVDLAASEANYFTNWNSSTDLPGPA
jgi:molybdenum cofactor guanylyltransferase